MPALSSLSASRDGRAARHVLRRRHLRRPGHRPPAPPARAHPPPGAQPHAHPVRPGPLEEEDDMTSVITIDSRDVDWPPERIADAHERAAELIEQDGLENGDMWADGLVLMYRPGISCCLVGALAVACGFRHVIDVEQN